MVLYNLAEAIRIVSILIQPFMTRTPERIWDALGLDDPSLRTWESSRTFGLYQSRGVRKTPPIFPRLDLEKEIEKLNAMLTMENENPAETQTGESEDTLPLIEFDDFSKVSLRVGTIKACERVKKSDRLLCSQVDMGTETRQIVSGIAASYQPEELVGRQVIVVTNLKPRAIRGVESNGMLLCAETEDGGYRLLTVDQVVASGSEVS
jgi:methionyl-tRNA synthetase